MMNNSPDRRTLRFDIDADQSVFDVMQAGAGMVLRSNQARSDLRLPRMRVASVSIELVVEPLSDDEQEALQRTGPLRIDRFAPFTSPDEVRQFFTVPALEAITDGPVGLDETTLAAMAAAVIKSRYHCDF